MIIFIPPNGGAALSATADTLIEKFGIFGAILIWAVCGLLGFGGMALFAFVFTPELVMQRPDGMEWFLMCLMGSLFLLFGPFSLPCGLFFGLMFGACNMLDGRPFFG
ncbi:MAG: hypothetical protein P4L90_25795 [Rhodopila sp.]|nr:hypothetical protein [Rhodopila sp.]